MDWEKMGKKTQDTEMHRNKHVLIFISENFKELREKQSVQNGKRENMSQIWPLLKCY